MTKDEKRLVYNLIKTASDSLSGFSSPYFPPEMPEFSDDAIPAESSVAAESVAGAPLADAGTASAPVSEKTPSAAHETVRSDGGDKLSSVREKISVCKRCVLSRTRTNVVPGMGVENPLVMVIGEAPGASEDMTGLPFVGAAGQLLDKMLGAISLSRAKNCYIANIVKCRPPENRNPLPEEADACRSFLDAQIAILKPKAILCAGSVAAKNLLRTPYGVQKLHGQILSYNSIPVVVTYHPSALLRYPENKRTAWEDLKIFREKLLEIEPGYNS